MKKLMFPAAMAAVVLMACSKEDDFGSDATTSNNHDRMFVTQVSMSNTAEIMAGQLAAQKGTDAGVRLYGQKMVSDHNTAQSNLRTAAASAGLTVSDSVSTEHQQLMQRLNNLSGYMFDTAYMNSQLSGHQKTILAFQMEINSGQNAGLRNYASQNLGTIQMHYTMADSIRRKL